jgi:hypothetical protein
MVASLEKEDAAWQQKMEGPQAEMDAQHAKLMEVMKTPAAVVVVAPAPGPAAAAARTATRSPEEMQRLIAEMEVQVHALAAERAADAARREERQRAFVAETAAMLLKSNKEREALRMRLTAEADAEEAAKKVTRKATAAVEEETRAKKKGKRAARRPTKARVGAAALFVLAEAAA